MHRVPSNDLDDHLLPEYDFDYSKAKSNRFSLSANFVPQVIISEKDYDQALSIAEPLVANRNLSNEESKFLAFLVTLIEDYENKHYPMGGVSPHAALLHLMEYSGTSESDLVGVIGTADVVSKLVSGKCSIDQIQSKALGEYFRVSASLFIVAI
jgi:HTH-type transcriptional regulator / antitoxin HigA